MKLIFYTQSSTKELRRLGAVERKRIASKVEQYANDPASLANQIKALKGSDAFRLRVGDYRVIFSEDSERIIVLKVGHRREVYD